MQNEIERILNDRESGSVALLNRLIPALESELRDNEPGAGSFHSLVTGLRIKLRHFAAIENFLASLLRHTGQVESFPEEALRFIADYRLYWKDAAGKLAENFLLRYRPENRTMLTHSHSETVISLISQLHAGRIPFRVIQTLSSPGEEGKKSFDRMRQLPVPVELVSDDQVKEVLGHTDLILMGCDALLATEFLNKTGTRTILEQAGKLHIPSFLVTESRKEILHPDWKSSLTDLSLFEWVPLDRVTRIVTERRK